MILFDLGRKMNLKFSGSDRTLEYSALHNYEIVDGALA